MEIKPAGTRKEIESLPIQHVLDTPAREIIHPPWLVRQNNRQFPWLSSLGLL